MLTWSKRLICQQFLFEQMLCLLKFFGINLFKSTFEQIRFVQKDLEQILNLFKSTFEQIFKFVQKRISTNLKLVQKPILNKFSVCSKALLNNFVQKHF